MVHMAKKQRSDDGCSLTAKFNSAFVSSQHELSQPCNITLNGIVKLNVGGIIYMTTYRTLVSHEGSKLAVFFTQFFSQIARNSPINLIGDDFVNITGDGQAIYPTIFIDRDGERFSHILNYLREGDAAIPEDSASRRAILQEARYFGLSMLEHTIRLLLDSNNSGMQTPRNTQKEDSTQATFSVMNIDVSQNTLDPTQLAVPHGYKGAPCLGSFTSIPSTSIVGHTYEDTQSYVYSQKSYEDEFIGSQKSLLQVVENDNIEDSAVFVQTTPLSQMGKTEFNTGIDF